MSSEEMPGDVARLETWDAAKAAASASEGDELLGTVLDGRYRIVSVISVGGVGTVYRAEQTAAVSRPVAVKVLRPALSGALGRVQRFEHEARITAQLRHPNTVRVFDSGRLENGQLYLVTELLEGTPLDHVLAGGPLPQLRAVRIARQICASLREAHELGIIHRDLKPGNVLLEKIGGQEVVKVLDFGMAKLVNFPGLTAPMMMCGTPGFMAPEQILGLRVDARTDVYALGVLLYQCLAGIAPFSAPTGMDLLVKHLRETPEALWVAADVFVDPELERLVAAMLAKSPDQRPATIEAVDEQLADIELELAAAERRARKSGAKSPAKLVVLSERAAQVSESAVDGYPVADSDEIDDLGDDPTILSAASLDRVIAIEDPEELDAPAAELGARTSLEPADGEGDDTVALDRAPVPVTVRAPVPPALIESTVAKPRDRAEGSATPERLALWSWVAAIAAVGTTALAKLGL